MKFSIGDRILLKQTGDEGRVTALISKTMVEVEVNGTTFPVHTDDIDHPYLKWFTGKTGSKKKALPEQLPVEKIADRPRRLAKGVYLSFMPVFKTQEMEDVVDFLKVFLLNEMPVNVRFSYDARLNGDSIFMLEGSLHAFGNVYLHSIPYPDMNEQPRLNWHLYDTSDKQLEAEGVLRIRPAKLFTHIDHLLKNNEATFSYLLADDLRPKPKPEQPEKFVPVLRPVAATASAVNNFQAPKTELDLHIEALVGNKKGMSNADIVQLQLDTLRHYLHLAITHRIAGMVIIHGLGKGRLKEEVHSVLRQTPEVGRFRNEWSGRYGFGATEVWFRY